MGRTTGWGKRPQLIKTLLQMIDEGAEKYHRNMGYICQPSFVSRWLPVLVCVVLFASLEGIAVTAIFRLRLIAISIGQ